MKTKNLFAASVLCLAGNFAIGAVLTVDNNPTSNAQYSSITTAIAAANDFDTLLVQPSATAYPSFTINKPLAVIGKGHNAILGWVLINNTITISSSNVICEGMYANSSINISSNQTDIVVRNCRTNSAISIGLFSNNILISGNVVGQFNQVFNTSNNILVLNNILDGVQTIVGNSETIIFKNNIIRASSSLFNSNSSLATFTDNIFYLTAPAHFNIESCTNCSFQNNLTYSPGGPVAESPNTTLNNVAPTWDLNGLTTPDFNYSINYEMLSGAPATGASDGGQVGIYGAGFNFEMNGFPLGIPRVTFTNIVNPVVFPDGEIEVDFEAEAGSN